VLIPVFRGQAYTFGFKHLIKHTRYVTKKMCIYEDTIEFSNLWNYDKDVF
jgi:hypothetical protein